MTALHAPPRPSCTRGVAITITEKTYCVVYRPATAPPLENRPYYLTYRGGAISAVSPSSAEWAADIRLALVYPAVPTAIECAMFERIGYAIVSVDL